MKTLGLYKKEKLCSEVAIEKLFSAGGADLTRLAYPLRMIVRGDSDRSSDAPVAFLISVPKKRLHHAVDRVLMRRRIREAFRLNTQRKQLDKRLRLDVAFIYVADRTTPFHQVTKAMNRLINNISEFFQPAENTPDADC